MRWTRLDYVSPLNLFVHVKNSFGKNQKLFFVIPLVRHCMIIRLYTRFVEGLSRFIEVYRGLPCIIIDDRPREALSNAMGVVCIM